MVIWPWRKSRAEQDWDRLQPVAQKAQGLPEVFEPRFHYWADRLGYLTWGEGALWGCNAAKREARDNSLREWREIVDRDRFAFSREPTAGAAFNPQKSTVRGE
jgi:hypothetical protein